MSAKKNRRLPAFIIAAALLLTAFAALAESPSGTFYGQNDHGVGGTIRVAVTMEDGKITGIKTLEQKETRGLGTTAILQLTKDFTAAGSADDADIVAGATLSSIAFTSAVRRAVEEATGYDPVAAYDLGDNEYLGISENALGGRLIVKVVIQNSAISSIDILEAHESEEIGMAALNAEIPKMISAGSAEVDSIAGATITCRALQEAVSMAVNTSRQ